MVWSRESSQCEPLGNDLSQAWPTHTETKTRAYPTPFTYWPVSQVILDGTLPTTQDSTAICLSTSSQAITFTTPPQTIPTGFPEGMKTDDPKGIYYILEKSPDPAEDALALVKHQAAALEMCEWVPWGIIRSTPMIGKLSMVWTTVSTTVYEGGSGQPTQPASPAVAAPNVVKPTATANNDPPYRANPQGQPQVSNQPGGGNPQQGNPQPGNPHPGNPPNPPSTLGNSPPSQASSVAVSGKPQGTGTGPGKFFKRHLKNVMSLTFLQSSESRSQSD